MEEDVILNKIMEDAEKEANAILEQARQKAQKIEEENKNRAIKQTKEQFDVVKAKIEREALSNIEKAEFESRSIILTEKKNIIEIVKQKVKQKIKDLSPNEYIKIIDDKMKKYKDYQNVQIILPKKCYKEIKKLALDYNMKVSDPTEQFESGVIIKCGNIEYNYDFEENMEFMDEQIVKEINTMLF